MSGVGATERSKISTTGISISELPFKVAQVKGFWREEGLGVEAILIRGAVGMQALLGARWITLGFRLDHRRGRARSAGQAGVHFFSQTAVRTDVPAAD